MNTVTLHFKADNQQLTALDGLYKLASNTVEYVKAIFTLGENWAGFDVVRAAWYTDFECISTVLDGNGECFVPWEVLSRPEGVTINLYGCDLEEESDGEAVLVDRLTTYPVKAILVDVDARVCGSETKPATPSQFEQYIAIVQELVGTVRDITSCVLNPDYTLTINYSDDTSDTVGPIRGEQGEQGPTGPAGNGISKIEKISTVGLVDTYRITFTNGTHKDYTVTNGAKGDTGNGIESIYLTGTSGAVKTYTILFTNGDTFEYQVTDGEVTRAELEAVLPTDTASGAIASFPDGSDLFDYLSCVVNIDPVQAGSGTPSPDNVRPITGWTGCEVSKVGVNVWDEEWEIGGIRTATGETVDSPAVRSKNYCRTKGGTSYYVACPSGYYVYFFFYDSNKTYLSYVQRGNTEYTTPTFTTPVNAAYFKLQITGSYGTTYNNDISINYPSTDTSYHAYNGTTYPVSWQTEAGTVYGGTVDLVSGVLTVDSALIDLGSLEWTYATLSSVGIFYANLNGGSQASTFNGLCSGYPIVASLHAGDDKVAYLYGSTQYGFSRIAIANSDYGTDANAFKVSLDGVQLVYELATPTTYQLTPTQIHALLGQNNVWANCGDTSVTYKADVQRWVEKKLGA